jgi:hypothetical protein
MRYMKLILIIACVAGFFYSCVACGTGGVTPQHQIRQETQQK